MLGKRAMTSCTRELPRKFIPWLELFDISTNGFNGPGYVSPADFVFGLQKASRHQADEEPFCFHKTPIPRIYGCRIDPDQDFIVLQVLPAPGTEGRPVHRISCKQSLSWEDLF